MLLHENNNKNNDKKQRYTKTHVQTYLKLLYKYICTVEKSSGVNCPNCVGCWTYLVKQPNRIWQVIVTTVTMLAVTIELQVIME